MTERGLPSTDGSPACPFVAFDDDRDARADRPDHRHRCFAEAEPAPRALAHQEAYCLSSAFPVCPTFQAWARREAAQARSTAAAQAAEAAGDGGAGVTGAATADTAGAAGGAGASTAPGSGRSGPAEEWTAPRPEDDIPIEARPRRNPPRDWAAPPPWATGAGAAAASGTNAGMPPNRATPPPTDPSAPDFLAPVPAEGRGLAGSAADRLASGGSVSDPGRDLPSAAPDPELAGLVAGGRAVADQAAMTDEERIAAGYPPPTRGGRRPAVSSTRSSDRDRDRRPPPREHVQDHAGPSWEHARRSEAYPVIKTRAGLGGLPGLPRVAGLALALGVAALALFFLPALLGIGGEDGATPAPSVTSAPVTTPPSPTPEPEPTPQTYTIKEGDTLSGIAREFGLTVDELLAANPDTISDPDQIAVGDEIIIPVPPPDEVSGEEEPTPEP